MLFLHGSHTCQILFSTHHGRYFSRLGFSHLPCAINQNARLPLFSHFHANKEFAALVGLVVGQYCSIAGLSHLGFVRPCKKGLRWAWGPLKPWTGGDRVSTTGGVLCRPVAGSTRTSRILPPIHGIKIRIQDLNLHSGRGPLQTWISGRFASLSLAGGWPREVHLSQWEGPVVDLHTVAGSRRSSWTRTRRYEHARACLPPCVGLSSLPLPPAAKKKTTSN